MTAEQRLRDRVARIPHFRTPTGPIGTMRDGRNDPVVPAGMPSAEYRRLVARNGKQAWTEQDEKDLRAKVARVRR